MEGTNLPVPEFTDNFQSYFDAKTDGLLEQAVKEFSPLESRCQKICKLYHHPNGKSIKTLNFKNLYEQLIPRSYRQRRLLIPAKDVPAEAWKSVRLLRVDFNMRKDAVTALAWSGHTGNLTNLTRLLRNGAYTDRPLLNGNTVLMETIYAFSANRLECVRALLSAGARVNIANQAGHTAMTVAASVGDLGIIKLLLSRRHQLDLEHKTKMGHTALTMAATAGHIDTVRYLVETFDANIIVEDHCCLTTLCWAHIKNPPIAAYLSVMLTVQDHADTFLKRRLEVIGRHPTDLNILSTFYSICLVFLQIRSVRDLLVRNGSLTTIMKHSKWESIDYCCGDFENEDTLASLTRDFCRIQPWIIALTCALAYNDTYIIEKFLQSDYDRVFFYINNMAKFSGIDKAARRLTQSALLPLLTNEKGRMRLLEMAEMIDWSLHKHLSDEKDLLSNEMFTIMDFFIENFDEVYGKYNLKALKASLDEATNNKVFPKPIYSLRKRLLDAIACFENFKRMLHQRNAIKESAKEPEEAPIEKPVEDNEKLSKRAKKMRKQLEETKKNTKTRARETSESRGESITSSNHEIRKVDNVILSEEMKSCNTKKDKKKLSAAEEFHKLWVEDITDKPPEEICANETSRIQTISELEAYNVTGMNTEVSQSSSSTSLGGYPEEAPILYRKASLEDNSDVVVLSHRVETVKSKPPASLFQPNTYPRNGLSNKQLKKMEKQKKRDRQQARNINRNETLKFQSGEYDTPISSISTPEVDKASKFLQGGPEKLNCKMKSGKLNNCTHTKDYEREPSNKIANMPQEQLKGPTTSTTEDRDDAVYVIKSCPGTASDLNIALNEIPSGTVSSLSVSLTENKIKSWMTDVSSEVDLYEGQYLSENGSQYETASSQLSWNGSLSFGEKLPLKTEDGVLFIPSIHDISFGDFSFPQNIVASGHPPNAVMASHLEEQLLGGAETMEQDVCQYESTASQEINDISENVNQENQKEEWERANPICHTLQKLHRAVSDESTNISNEADHEPLTFGDFDDLSLSRPMTKGTTVTQSFNPSVNSFLNFPAYTGFSYPATRAPPGFNRVFTLMEMISWTPQSCRWNHLYEIMLNTPITRFTVNGPLYLEPNEEYCLSKGSTVKSTFLGINKNGNEIVVKCLDKQSGKLVIGAIKQLRQGDLISANILKYKGFSENEFTIYLEMGLCEYNLEEYLCHLGKVSNVGDFASELCRQLLSGLAALHAVGIIHMNLKPTNVLIDNTGCIRLADYGLPHHLQQQQDEKLCWKPREMLKKDKPRPYDTKSDVQVAGMLLYYIMTRKHPYGNIYGKCEENIKANNPDLTHLSNVSNLQVFAHLMTWMLHPGSSRRKDIKTCLTHPFFWSAEKMFTFLKLVSQEPEMNIKSTEGDEVCEAFEEAQGWMGLEDNEMNTVVQKILYEQGIETKSVEVKHVLRAMVLAQDKFKSWPNGFYPLFMKSPDAIEISHNPMTFFLTHYSRVFIGVYDIISHSPWRNRAALSLFFDKGPSMDIYLRDIGKNGT